MDRAIKHPAYYFVKDEHGITWDFLIDRLVVGKSLYYHFNVPPLMIFFEQKMQYRLKDVICMSNGLAHNNSKIRPFVLT